MVHVCYAETLYSYSPVNLKINVYTDHLFFFNFLIRSFHKYYLHNTFIFILDKHRPVSLENPREVGRLISTSPFLKSSMSSCTPIWMWVYSRGPPFSFPDWRVKLYCGWNTCGAVIPWLKGRTFHDFLCLVVSLVYNRIGECQLIKREHLIS
jgi:hypothetical protein